MDGIWNAKLVIGDRIIEGGLAFEGGQIAGILDKSAGRPSGDFLDAAGGYAIPGVFDPEAHLGSNRSLETDLRSESKAAIAAGVTTWNLQQSTHAIYTDDQERPSPDENLVFSELVGTFESAVTKASYCDISLTPIVMSEDQAAEIPELAEVHGVTTYKLYMHMRLGEKELTKAWPQAPLLGVKSFDDGLVYKVMQAVAGLGPKSLLSIHCENWEIARIREEEIRRQGRSDHHAWHDRSPSYLEAMHVRCYGYLAGQLGCPVHIQHVTSHETLEAIRGLRAEGVPVVGQSGLHYLCLPDDAWKLNTPLRPESDREALWEALADGRLDSLGSDHVCRGMTREDMDSDDVWTRKSGFPSRVEAHLPLLLGEGVSKGRISINRAAEVSSTVPSKLWGLYPRKGSLLPGADADVVIVDMAQQRTLGPKTLVGDSRWTLYEGWDVQGWPVATIKSANLVAEWHADDVSLSDERFGQYLPRSID